MPVLEKECQLKFEFHPNEVLEEIKKIREKHFPGPEDFAMKDCKIIDKNGNQVRVVTNGDPYTICCTLLYDKRIGGLHPDFVYNVTVIDLSSCDVVTSMCFSCEGEIECPSTQVQICMPMTCDHEGVFGVTVTASLGDGNYFDYHCFDFCFACHHSCLHEKLKPVVG